ncbi:MAG: gcrA cell cycle regulator family protein [Alphaproteobacteria bacterium CG_4_9_14_3_um_filter_47_13]|nr:MAG: gcrA cell cycle regulator family protein [Alphaproteobacteria bacterium CG_4_9_14_3_um_filter_47_13]
MSWTDERIAVLKKMWGEGKTAAEIAKELGGVTRNAVIGKAHRLKLSNRLSPIQQNNKKVTLKSVEEKKPPRKVANDPRSMDLVVKRLSLAELKDKMCRWPIGDPKDEGFCFCGLESISGLPYCDGHARVAYQAASRSRVFQVKDFEEKQNDDEDVKESAVA